MGQEYPHPDDFRRIVDWEDLAKLVASLIDADAKPIRAMSIREQLAQERTLWRKAKRATR